MSGKWILANAEELSAESPDSFSIPEREKRENLSIGDYAKLVFRSINSDNSKESQQPSGERMWVKISKKTSDGYEGVLDNDPQVISTLSAGDLISFRPENVIDFQH